MSNRGGRGDAHDRQQASKQRPASSQPGDAPKTEGEKNPSQRSPVRLKSPQSLERLRDRVKTAARELERLRKENAALNARLKQLEARPAAAFDGTVLPFEEDPETLRQQVEDFIEAIDAYLAKESDAF